MKLLSVRNLSVTIRGIPILSELSFDMAPGRVFGLVGESGSGKSMTALALMGLLPHGARRTGSALFQGQDLLRMAEAGLCRLRGNKIGMIFQEPMTALNPPCDHRRPGGRDGAPSRKPVSPRSPCHCPRQA
jgi:peptide/nickel transport system ATP-binding protein